MGRGAIAVLVMQSPLKRPPPRTATAAVRTEGRALPVKRVVALRSKPSPTRRRVRSVRAQKTQVALPPAPVSIPEGDWKVLERGVTAPKGFRAAAISAGLRALGTKPDLSFIFCDTPALAAGVFTQSALRAAPVLYDQEMLEKKSHVRGVLTNAGQANAATGSEGYEDTCTCAAAAAEALHLPKDEILIMSTGVIGHRIKMDNLLKNIPPLMATLDTGLSADIETATALTTTDLVYKTAAIEMQVDGKTVTLGGACKGSGMINPNMATMLGVITCDANIDRNLWKHMVSQAMDLSFNRITVDGDTSTNDTVLALTSGKAGNPVISDPVSPAGQQLQNALTALSQGLAKSVAWDGEGATCLIEVSVGGAESDADALTVAKSVASSMLVKSAVFGNDPNWGRIGAAAGYSGVPFSQEDLDIALGDIQLMKDGRPVSFDRAEASTYLKGQCSKRGTVEIGVRIGKGTGRGMAWGCDLSYDYVRINAEYTT